MIAAQLEHVMGLDAIMRQEVYQQLINAKNRTLSSLQDILDKDLKFAVNNQSGRRIAVPSISGQLVRQALKLTPSPLSSSSSSSSPDDEDKEPILYSVPPETFAHLEEFRVSTKSEAVVILGIVNSDPDNIQRDIALFSSDPTLIQQVSFFGSRFGSHYVTSSNIII